MRRGIAVRLIRNVWRAYQGWHLSTRLFVILSLLTVSLFVALQWNNLNGSRKILREQHQSESQQIMLRSNQFLSAYYENIKTTLLLISSQPSLLGDTDISAELRHYTMYSSPLIKTLYVVKKSGTVYCSNEVIYDILGNDKIRQICDTAENGLNGVQFTSPYYTSISSDTVAFFIPIRKDSAYQGAIIAEVNLDTITQNLAPMVSANGQSFLVTDSTGTPICYDTDSMLIPFVPRQFPIRIDPTFQSRLRNLPQGPCSMRFHNRSLLLLKSSDNGLGWNIYLFSNSKILNDSLSRLYLSFSLSVLLGLLFILVSVFLISYYFTNPIRQLALKMDKLRMLDHLPVLYVDRNDETGLLIRSFNAMMERINRLVTQLKTSENEKKEYEFKMLQSQIRPHFLYNTLACIGSLARQRRDGEIQETIQSLVGLLSFSFDKREEFVTLREELTGLHMYLNIQRTRYGDIFVLREDISPAGESCLLPKLTLQPIIENALFHGILPKQTQGTIWIRARIVGKNLILSLRDDGVGYSGKNGPDSAGYEETVSHYRFNAVGLRNVNERIRANYGEPYGLRIRGMPGTGTVVRLRLPVVRMDAHGHVSEIRPAGGSQTIS